MSENPKAVISAGPAASSAPSSGDAQVVAVVAAAPVQAPAPVKLSRSQKTAANIAASMSKLSVQPASSSQLTAEQIAPSSLELSPEAAKHSESDIAKLFLGKPLETAPAEEQKEETEENPENEVTTETETETETEEGETSETETETETEVESLSRVAGITKELQAKGVSPKLIKRFEELAKQNSERGELLKRQDTKPILVAAPTDSHPLSNVVNEHEIDAAVKATQAEARTALRKLQRMDGVGGIWDEGGENERELTAKDVDAWITHYERVLDEAPTIGNERKLYLKTYAETAKTLGKPAAELLNPKEETRESKIIRAIPELMRDPEYLRFLADAQVGRELREKKAKGVQTVEIDPTAKPKSGSVAAKAAHATTPATAKAAAQVRSPEAGLSMDELRSLAEKGNQKAIAEISRRFMVR